MIGSLNKKFRDDVAGQRNDDTSKGVPRKYHYVAIYYINHHFPPLSLFLSSNHILQSSQQSLTFFPFVSLSCDQFFFLSHSLSLSLSICIINHDCKYLSPNSFHLGVG